MENTTESRGRILVADDDETFRETTVELLQREGFTVVGVPNAPAGMAALDGSPFDLALVDVNMPGNCDLALVRQLIERVPRLPVVIVTGFPSVQTAVSAVNLSVAAYLIKPVATEDLIRVVRRAFEQGRACRTVEDSMERLSQWKDDLQTLSRSIQPRSDSTTEQLLGAFLTLTVRNITAALTDVRRVAQVLVDRNAGSDAVKALEASRPLVLISALQDAVLAIERTKSTFKSRELAVLRSRLEGLLRDDFSGTRPSPPARATP